MNGKAVILREPKITLAQVCEFVPRSLQESRYQLYCVQQRQHWNNQPLYLCDEWVAYCNGCAVALEDFNAGRGKENTDEAVGPLEMGVYSVAMMMATAKYDPSYFSDYPRLKQFIAHQWKTTHDLFSKASIVFPWDTQDRIVKCLNESPDAEEMRKFIREHLSGIGLTK